MAMTLPPVHGWNPVARALHWGVALAIAVEVPAGLVMSRTSSARDPAVRTIWAGGGRV